MASAFDLRLLAMLISSNRDLIAGAIQLFANNQHTPKTQSPSRQYTKDKLRKMNDSLDVLVFGSAIIDFIW